MATPCDDLELEVERLALSDDIARWAKWIKVKGPDSIPSLILRIEESEARLNLANELSSAIFEEYESERRFELAEIVERLYACYDHDLRIIDNIVGSFLFLLGFEFRTKNVAVYEDYVRRMEEKYGVREEERRTVAFMLYKVAKAFKSTPGASMKKRAEETLAVIGMRFDDEGNVVSSVE